jgi:hypothetical protein
LAKPLWLRLAGHMGPDELLRVLLEPSRLAVLGAIAIAPRSLDEVVEATGVAERDVLGTIGPLVVEGLVGREDGRYWIEADAWRATARQLPQAAPADPRIAFGMTSDEAEVLARFFTGERLIELPAQQRKRLVVLERLALEFEPGRRYEESEVNAILHRFHDDHATLRRELVDAQLLDRDAGTYWRAGGRVV